jgi:hypothetical protein
MAQHRVEETFVANNIMTNTGTDLHIDTNTFHETFPTYANLPEAYYVGIVNADNDSPDYNKLIDITGLTTLPATVRNIRFVTHNKTRGFRMSDVIDRRSINRAYKADARAYNPVVYHINLSGIATAAAGDRVILTIQLRQEVDFCYEKIFIEHTFTSGGSVADVQSICQKINSAILEKYRGFKPLYAFVGLNTVDSGIPPLGNNIGTGLATSIYIIAGNNTLDMQNIVQNKIYDFDVFLSSAYRVGSGGGPDVWYEGNWNQVVTSATITKGAVDQAVNPITYQDGTNNPKVLGGVATFVAASVATAGQKAQDSLGYYDDIITSLHNADLGNQGYINRVMFEDTPDRPNITKGVAYNVYHIEYEGETRTPGHSPERSNKPKRFNLYLNTGFGDTADPGPPIIYEGIDLDYAYPPGTFSPQAAAGLLTDFDAIFNTLPL